MVLEVAGLAAAAGAGTLAWAVRGRSSVLLAPGVWRGPRGQRRLALTFDDGPSESTRQLLGLLDRYGVRATFFQCGHHVRRLAKVAREVAEAGHEIGNHTDTHPALHFRSPNYIHEQLRRAQEAIVTETGYRPRLFRPPYGVRWFGLREAQRKLGLLGVMWTAIARDWALPAEGIAARLWRATAPGAILCLHDGRALKHDPGIQPTIDAAAGLLPRWLDEGYELVTVSELIGLNRPPPQGP
jgi:peptidoglycan/xylan/chitin deacetylase (PgdA/CDA1 family)